MRSILILDFVGLYLHVPICLHGVTINKMNMAVLQFLYTVSSLGRIEKQRRLSRQGSGRKRHPNLA
jgi:hypothetical protein